jgi:hypothetical protein
MSAEKQMVRANTRRVITTMAGKQTIRNRTVSKLIGNAMGKKRTVVYPNNSIASGIGVGSPQPAFRMLFDLRPKAFGCVSNGANLSRMTEDKAQSLTFDVPLFSACLLGNRSWLSTATVTQLRTIKAKLNRFWYTSHADASYKVLAALGMLDASPSFLMPNYTMIGGPK